ncbi:MAG: IS200/IS605 family transposase [Clostridia bacterium]|nr:IS200/IS605 family transposase [Clostridia bacterium]
MDNNSIAHTTWECKYHIVFAPKFRRKVIYGELKQDIGPILRMLCERKGVELIEGECCADHIHILVRIPPKMAVSDFVGYLKGKSSLMIFDRHAHLKYKYGNRHFWCRGYYVDTVGKNTKKIQEYIQKQLQEDIANDQISIYEHIDPFTGEPVKNRK